MTTGTLSFMFTDNYKMVVKYNKEPGQTIGSLAVGHRTQENLISESIAGEITALLVKAD